MDLKVHFVNDLDLYPVSDFYLFSNFSLMYPLILIYTILDYFKNDVLSSMS